MLYQYVLLFWKSAPMPNTQINYLMFIIWADLRSLSYLCFVWYLSDIANLLSSVSYQLSIYMWHLRTSNKNAFASFFVAFPVIAQSQ